MTPLTMIGPRSIARREAGHLVQRQAISAMPARISSRASTLPTSRPTTIIEISVPTPRGAVSKPDCEHRIAEQALEHRRQQGEAGEQHHAHHRHEQQAGREIAVGEHLRVEDRIARGQHVDDEHPQAGDGEPGLDPDLPAREPVELLAAVEHHLQRRRARARAGRSRTGRTAASGPRLAGMKRSISRRARTPTGRLIRNTQRQL